MKFNTHTHTHTRKIQITTTPKIEIKKKGGERRIRTFERRTRLKQTSNRERNLKKKGGCCGEKGSECLIAATHTNSNEGDVFIHGNDVNRRVQHAHTDGARKEGRGRRKTKNIYTHTHSINIFFVVLVYRRGQPNSRTRSSRRDLFPSHHTHTADSRCVCVCVCNA